MSEYKHTMTSSYYVGPRSESPSKQSRFSELLGKKEKEEPIKQVPKSLDDFMASISSKTSAGSGTGSKRGEAILQCTFSIEYLLICFQHVLEQFSNDCRKLKYAITIATVSDWFKNLAPVHQPMKMKTKTNSDLHTQFLPRFEQVT